MLTDKELYERANPVSKTAITTLVQRAAECYQAALDAGYEPDETDKKYIEEVLGKQ